MWSFLCSSRKHLEIEFKKYIIFVASAVACNLWRGKVTEQYLNVQRLHQGWVARAEKSHLKNARRLLFSFLFVITENEILPWSNFHILTLLSPTLHSVQIIFTTVTQMIKGVLLTLNVMENFYWDYKNLNSLWQNLQSCRTKSNILSFINSVQRIFSAIWRPTHAILWLLTIKKCYMLFS